MVELPVWMAMLKFHMRNRIRLDEVFGSSVVVSFWCVADFLPESRKAEKQCTRTHCQIEVKTVQKKKKGNTTLIHAVHQVAEDSALPQYNLKMTSNRLPIIAPSHQQG